MGRALMKLMLIISIMAMAVFLPLISMRTTMNLSEISRMVDTSDAIQRHLETACINALEQNLDYNAKANGIAILRPGHNVGSMIIAEMEVVLASYVANNNFEGDPVVVVNSVVAGGGTDIGDGRYSNFAGLGSPDVTVDGFTGNFPGVSATVSYTFRSVLADKTRPSQSHTVMAEMNHTHIQQNNWND